MNGAHSELPQFDPSSDYFDEVFALSFKNQSLSDEIDTLTEELQSIWKQIQKYEKKLYGKKERRTDAELKKFFDCPECSKEYAYKSSLLMHIKLKHKSVKISKA